MISTDGKTFIKRALTGAGFARSLAVGVGPKAEAVGDTALNFEIARVDITLVSYDFVNGRVVFKGALPPNLSAKIYEVGLWSQLSNIAAGEYYSRALASFDSTELWSVGTFQVTNARVGIDALRLAPTTSATSTSLWTDLFLDLSGNSGADKFSVAFFNGNANAASVKFRFKTDASNYYTFSIATPPTGYQVTQIAKSTATLTGTPSWASITSMEVEVVAGAGGAAAVDFDGIRIEDVDTLNPDYIMVSRELLAAPVTKTAGRAMDVEFYLPVTV